VVNACPRTLDADSDTAQGKAKDYWLTMDKWLLRDSKGLRNTARTPDTAQLVVQ
jgi:hypothetical protein